MSVGQNEAQMVCIHSLVVAAEGPSSTCLHSERRAVRRIATRRASTAPSGCEASTGSYVVGHIQLLVDEAVQIAYLEGVRRESNL